MKICWDNLEGLIYEEESGLWVKKFTYFRKGRVAPQIGLHKYKYVENCKWCNKPFLTLINNIGKFCCKSCGVCYKQTGKDSPLRGRKHSKETVDKIRKANTGKIRTLEMRENYSKSKSGKNNPWFGITGKDHPRYGTKGNNFEINLEAMYDGLRNKLKENKLPFNKKGHPFKGIKRPDFSGSNNPNWKGGVTSPIVKFRKSIEYKKWRKEVFERDNYTCQNCSRIGKKLQAHHIIPLNYIMDNNLTSLKLDTNNGITFCISCHKKYHQNFGYKYGI